MEKIEDVLGWDVFDDTPALEQPQTSVSPQEQMLDAIRKKDIDQLKASLSLGANPKVLVGKEKMAVFAMRNFCEDVVRVLQKSGVSFKDFSSMESAVFETDNLNAFQWIVNNKNPKLKNPDVAEFLTSAAKYGACNIFNYISQKSETRQQISSNITGTLFSNALTMGNETTISYLLNNRKDNHIEQMFRIVLRQTKCSSLQLQNLSKMLKDHPHCIPALKSSIQHVEFYMPQSEVLSVAGFQNCYSPKESRLWTTGITTLLEFLLYQNNDVVVNVFAQPAGKEKLAQIIEKRGEFFFSFLASQASRELRQGVLKHTKDVWQNWRDSNSSNAFHYLASRSPVLKTLCEDLYTLDSELLTTPDNTGKTPLMSFPADHAAVVTKKMMKKELRSSGVVVSNAIQPSKRKM